MYPVSGVLTAPKVNSNMRIFIWKESVYQACLGSARGNDKFLCRSLPEWPFVDRGRRFHGGAKPLRSEALHYVKEWKYPPPVLFYFTVIFYLTPPTFCWNRFNLLWVNPKFWLETNDSSPPHTHKQPSPPHHPVYCFSYPSLKKLNAGVHGRVVGGGNGRGKWCNCIVISKNKGKNLKIRILAYWNIQAKRLLKKTCSNLWVYIVR